MPKTAVGLFEDTRGVDDAIRQLEALGFPRNEVRSLKEPATFEITGQMSFPRLDFEVDLKRELVRIGATKAEVEAYADGLRRGGTLIFATSPDEGGKVDEAVNVMNRCGAVGVGEAVGAEPHFPRVAHAGMTPTTENPVLAGRLRQEADGACVFIW